MDSKPKVSLPKLDAKEVDNNANPSGSGSDPMKAAASASQNFEAAGQRRVSMTRGIPGGVSPSHHKQNAANRNLHVATANVRIND